jgi:hypothetical protein
MFQLFVFKKLKEFLTNKVIYIQKKYMYKVVKWLKDK